MRKITEFDKQSFQQAIQALNWIQSTGILWHVLEDSEGPVVAEEIHGKAGEVLQFIRQSYPVIKERYEG